MHRIVGTSVRLRRAVVLAAVGLLVFGTWQLRDAKVDVLPEFSPPTVEVQTEALGLSAEEVEQFITVPLEQDLLAGVAWLDTIHSRSVPGLSSIELIFEKGTDLYRARQVVQERISQAAGLPNVSRPPQMLQPQSSLGRAAMVSLSSKTLNPVRIGVLARWTIRPRLLAVPGVASVAIWGQRERQLQVQVDPQKLAGAGVTLEQVVSSTGNGLWVSPLTFLEASTPGTGGFIDTPNQRLGIQHNLPIIGPRDLGKIAIEETGKKHLTLDDVATVVEDHQPLIGDALVAGTNADEAGFMLVIEKLPGANTSEVADGVEAALDDLRPGLQGLTIDSTVFRPASYVDRSVHNASRWVVIGAVLAAIALGGLLSNWRRALVALVAIATSFVAAALALRAFGQTFTVVLLAGLVLALVAVVDDAITTVDNVSRRLGTQADERDRGSKPGLVAAATLETGRNLQWALVILAVALAPIFLINGLSGDAFFPPVARACLVAVVASLIVTITLVPAMCVYLLPQGTRSVSATAERLRNGYERVVRGFSRTLVPAIVVAMVLLVAAAVVVPGLDKSLLPPLKDPNLMIRWDGPFGTSLGEMDRITARASAELRALPGVRNVNAQVGQAVLGDQPVGADSALMWVTLDGSTDYDATRAAIAHVVAGYPGIRHQVLTYSQERMREVLGREKNQITVRVFGDDFGVLYDRAGEIRKRLATIDGVTGARVASPQAEPTIEVQVDLAKARAAGIKPGDVRRAAATLLSGLRVGNLFEDQKVFDVVVWSNPSSRRSLSSVQSLLIDTPTGGHTRLSDVANVRIRPTLPDIEHEDISRFVDVTANVKGRDVGAVTNAVHDQLDAVKFPLEYHAEVLGDYASQQDAQRRLLAFVIAAAVGVFLLLQAAFSSWRMAAIAAVLLPVALSGGVLAARLDGGTATLATIVGLLAVFIVSVRSSLTFVARVHRLRADEGMDFGERLVARAARDGFTPAVATAVTTTVALVPALLMTNGAGLEVVRSIAVVVIAGLATALAASLLVLPSLYLHLGPRREAPAFEAEDLLDVAHTELSEAAPPVSAPIARMADS